MLTVRHGCGLRAKELVYVHVSDIDVKHCSH